MLGPLYGIGVVWLLNPILADPWRGVFWVNVPLTLIASVFGMNVHFPGEGEGWAFLYILILMAAVFAALVVLFRRRGWL